MAPTIDCTMSSCTTRASAWRSCSRMRVSRVSSASTLAWLSARLRYNRALWMAMAACSPTLRSSAISSAEYRRLRPDA